MTTTHPMQRAPIPGWARASVLALALAATVATAAAQSPASIDARVDALLRRMTLEEKVGEMTQLTIQAVSRTEGTPTVEHQLDSAKLEEALVRNNVGSLLNVWDVAFTPQHWREVITTVQRFAARKRLHSPVIYGIDAVHGHHYMVGATVFPQNLAMAATWNPELVRRENEITAYETRASGITWNFSPVLDLGRQPLWSRFFETFGEDPYLATVLGVAAVEGEQHDPRPDLATLLQSGSPRVVQHASRRGAPAHDDPPVGGTVFVAATGKHFLGYSMPLSGKDRTTAWIPERQLREYFVPTFKGAIGAGLRTVMINSGDINGIPVHSSHEILTGLLRHELGFTGVTVSDWEDINKLYTVHHVAASRKDAVRMAVMAGVDMSMVPFDFSFTHDLIELVHEGAVPESRIDEAVRRILKLKFELGLFDNPGPDPAMLANVGAPVFQAVSRQAAEEAVTLLKNDRALLPLSKRARVLVTGPGATSLPALHGSWTHTWQGTNEAMYPTGVKSVLDAIRAEIGAGQVTYVPGTTEHDAIDIAAAADAARRVDAAIVVLAEMPSTEKPGDIDDLTLPDAQLRLAAAVEATGTPTVLVLVENRPRIVRTVVDSARAVLMAYETGPFGGEAVARILFGDVNPSGKLPFTYPRYTGAIEHYDRAPSADVTADKPEGGYDPQWPFGYGLSYTTFAYSDLTLNARDVGRNDTLTISVTVANTGARAGKEVVQLYVRDLYASVEPPMKRLRGFEKIELAPGARRTVTFRLPIQQLAFIGRDDRPVVEPGDFDVMIGGLTQRFTVR
ncbi:MAG: glycoside hydrolase family 3 C-terminal domain-containing protein [Gemmatimonadaceae bacterium]|nr:glycoside hydrolase family 3 C-terminal domain-containing protein [Gemmatimonadaceae bacterium]